MAAGALGLAASATVDSQSAEPAWAKPLTMAVSRAGPLPIAQHAPNFLSNLDCDLLDYHLVGQNTMQSGCFTPTAYGLMDISKGVVIFNGSDEGLPLLSYSPNDALVPWPRALDALVLNAAPTGGTYLGLYRNPLASVHDQRNTLGQLTAKQITVPPDLTLKDVGGKPLIVNPQTIAFSSGDSWLVAETLSGSFLRINLATLEETAFAGAYGTQGSPGLLKSQVAVSDSGRYVAIYNAAARELKVYDLADCSQSGGTSTACASYDYLPFLDQKISGLKTVNHLRFANDGLLSFEAQTGDGSGDGVYELAPRDKITSMIDYLGLGDSYTSGEGAFDYLTGTDTSDNMCHLSIHSYPLLLSRDLFSQSGGHSVACSGAVINDVGDTSPDYRGQVRGVKSFKEMQAGDASFLDSIMANYRPGYLAQQRFARQYQPAIITVSVGGDDIGFGDILEQCVTPHVSLHWSDNTCFSTYEDRLEIMQLIDRTIPRWTGLFKQLAAASPGSQIYALGYPDVASDTGNCGFNVHLSKSELEFARELVSYLDTSISRAALKAGVNYIDINQALAGHRLCEAAGYDVAVNGLTAGKDAGFLGLRVFGKESYHPNALGQQLIEQAIMRGAHNFVVLPTPVPDSEDGQKLLQAPKTGRPINSRVPAKLTSGVAKRGQAMAIATDGAKAGLKPLASYVIRLDGPAGRQIGQATSDDQSNVSASVTVPGDTVPGGHTADLTGENQSGEQVDVTQPIFVPVNDQDADGDGLPDNTDSCPAAVNADVDSDNDGIDDSCDNFIGPAQPPLNPQQGGDGSVSASNSQDSGSITPVDSDTNGPTGIATGATPPAGIQLQAKPISLQSMSVANTYKKDLENKISAHLGSVTAKPEGVSKNFKSPGLSPRQSHVPFSHLPVIQWWYAILPVILWFLLLLGSAIRRLAKNSRLYQNSKLFNTIEPT